jgi:hypothetical protein
MIRKCGWCGKYMGTNDLGDPEDVTHGICQSCRDMVREEMKELNAEPALEPIDTLELLD